MDHIFGAELWMLSPATHGEDGRTGGLLLIATPTGKHWHWMPLTDYDNREHLHAMALHYIDTLGLQELTVIECATQEAYVLARDDDAHDHHHDHEEE